MSSSMVLKLPNLYSGGGIISASITDHSSLQTPVGLDWENNVEECMLNINTPDIDMQFIMDDHIQSSPSTTASADPLKRFMNKNRLNHKKINLELRSIKSDPLMYVRNTPQLMEDIVDMEESLNDASRPNLNTKANNPFKFATASMDIEDFIHQDLDHDKSIQKAQLDQNCYLDLQLLVHQDQKEGSTKQEVTQDLNQVDSYINCFIANASPASVHSGHSQAHSNYYSGSASASSGSPASSLSHHQDINDHVIPTAVSQMTQSNSIVTVSSSSVVPSSAPSPPPYTAHHEVASPASSCLSHDSQMTIIDAQTHQESYTPTVLDHIYTKPSPSPPSTRGTKRQQSQSQSASPSKRRQTRQCSFVQLEVQSEEETNPSHRLKNNAASKKSRTSKRDKQKEMEKQIAYYVEDNKNAEERIAELTKQIQFCKDYLFNKVMNAGRANNNNN